MRGVSWDNGGAAAVQATAAVEHWELMLLKAKQAGDKKAEAEVGTIPRWHDPGRHGRYPMRHGRPRQSSPPQRRSSRSCRSRSAHELHAATPRAIQSAFAHTTTCAHAHMSACAHRQDTWLCHNCS